MGSKEPQPLPEMFSSHYSSVPGVSPDRLYPPPPSPKDCETPRKEKRIMVEEITIAETINGFIVTTPNSFSGRDTRIFEQREGDDCVVEALINALYNVIEGLGCQGTKHDICRIKVWCQNEGIKDA